MKNIKLTENEKSKFGEVIIYVQDWCSRNQWAVGIGEMAAGAELIAAGIHIGNIHMGADLLGTKLSGFNPACLATGAFVGGAGAFAGAILGGIGVAACGGAIGIPASLLISGGSVVFGAAGYSVGDIVHNFLNPSIDIGQVFAGTSLLAIGTALLIDGARRLITDEAIKRLLSNFRDGVIRLAQLTAEVVADPFDALKRLVGTAGPASSGVAGAAAGAVVGSSVAAGTVTVLGSHAVGGLALSLGLVSAPLWPVIAGGAAGCAVGYAAWRAIRALCRR